jgi:hypothetical protein
VSCISPKHLEIRWKYTIIIIILFDLIYHKKLQIPKIINIYTKIIVARKLKQRNHKACIIDILYRLDSASLLVKLKPRIFQRLPHLNRWWPCWSFPLANKRLKNNNNFHHFNSLKMYNFWIAE